LRNRKSGLALSKNISTKGPLNCRSLGSPDFLSSLVASVNLVRLSLEKAAYVVVDESSVVGNPEFGMTKGGGALPWGIGSWLKESLATTLAWD
jgi:hypothetical protein